MISQAHAGLQVHCASLRAKLKAFVSVKVRLDASPVASSSLLNVTAKTACPQLGTKHAQNLLFVMAGLFRR